MARRTAALRVVGKPSPARPPVSCLETPCGASASVDGDSILIRDRTGALIVRFDASTGTATVAAPAGDLRLEAPKGKVIIAAGTDLELQAPGQTLVHSKDFAVDVEKASLRGRLAELVVEAIEVTSPSAALSIGRWQLRAERIFEQASEAYKDVEGVLETRAGRLRSKIEGAMQWFSKSTSIVSEEDTFVDGKRVLLG